MLALPYMEAINARLKQLEALETNLYLRRQTIIQIREREDEKLQLRRQEEDQDYLRSLQDRDQEEDVRILVFFYQN